MPDNSIASALALANTLAQCLAFTFGACVGSFLNVVIARLPEGLSIVRPASRCPRCLTPIAWYDNVPLLGWLWLRGRCRNCKLPISVRYPTVELLVALLGLAVYREAGPVPHALFLFAFVALLVAATYIDLDTWIIPFEVTIPGIVLGVADSFFRPNTPWRDALLTSLIGGVSGFALFWLVATLAKLAFKKEALGMGDWWLLAMIGATLGWTALLPVILLASLQGSVIGIALLVAGKLQGETPKLEAEPALAPEPVAAAGSDEPAPTPEAAGGGDDDEDDWVPPPHALPFGPFLALGAIEQLFLGDWLRLLYELLLRKLM